MKATRYELEVEVNGITFGVEASFWPGIAGRFSGPPEECFPDEPAELEVHEVYLTSGSNTILVPFELLEEFYVANTKRFAGIDGKMSDVRVAGQTVMDAIVNAAMEKVFELQEKAVRERDDDAHGDWLADRSFRG